jgi:hypothetical protein
VTITQSTLTGQYIGLVSAGANTLTIDDSDVYGGDRALYLTATHSGSTTVTGSSLEATDDEAVKLGFYSTYYGSWQPASGNLSITESTFVGSSIPTATVSFDGSSVELVENWWGQSTGPTGSDVTGPDASVVDTSVWCTTADCSAKSS